MAVGSVFNHHTLQFDLYEVPGPPNPAGFSPMSGMGISARGAPSSGIGLHIEDALPALPRGSRLIGQSVQAQGRIYATPVDDGVGGVEGQRSHFGMLVALSGVMLVALRLLRSPS